MRADAETIGNSGLRFWSTRYGDSPVIGTAIHDGHNVRGDVAGLMALSDGERLREEDPFTAEMISGLCNQIIVHRSRFEIDLNRQSDKAIYLDPQQAWGLNVWRKRPSDTALRKSLNFHQDYYAMLEQTLRNIEKRHGAFVVLDVHSYNHRRAGPNGPATPQDEAPDVNIGTSSMDREKWDGIIDVVIEHFREVEINGRPLDVRENVAFQGKGEQTRFIHECFPENGCAVAIEFKKIFMDEWTGEPDQLVIDQIRDAITSLEQVLTDVLRRRQ